MEIENKSWQHCLFLHSVAIGLRRKWNALFDNKTFIMPICVFECCRNRSFGRQRKKGVAFYSFNDVPPPVSEQWTKIVARERRDPNFKPNQHSWICSEHFASYEITPSKTLYSTAIPTINIGPYDDTVVLDEDANSIDRDANLVCIIENNIATQPSIDQEDDIICVIENQICAEPTPQATDEQDLDIEDQIQWSLVGTSKHFDGLIAQKVPVTQQPPKPIQVERKSYKNENVILVTHEDSETESETEFKNQNSQFVKRPKKISKPIISKIIEQEIYHEDKSDRGTEKEFNDQYSQFLKSYDRSLYNYKRKKINTCMDGSKLGQVLTTEQNNSKNFVTSTQQPTPTLKRFAATTQQCVPTAQNQFENSKQQPKPSSPKKTIIIPDPTAPKQLKTTIHQSMPTAPEQYTIMTQQTIPTAALQQLPTIAQQIISTVPQQFIATTQQPIPVHLIKSSKLTPPQFSTTPLMTTTPQFAAAPHIMAPVFATTQQTSTPIMVYDATTPPPANRSTQLVKLVPSHFSVSGVNLSTVVLEDNNVKTYYLSNILPSSGRLLFESDPIGDGLTTQKCFTLNDYPPGTKILVKSSQNSEQIEQVLVKTEDDSD